MKTILAAAGIVLLTTGLTVSANAKVPALNHTCPIGVGMFTDAEGRVYIDGQEAQVKATGDNRYTATVPGLVISIGVNPDGSARVSYAAKGASGACRLIPPPSEDNG